MKRDWDNLQDVIDAVAKAQRTAGWSNRRGDVQRIGVELAARTRTNRDASRNQRGLHGHRAD